MFPKAFLTLSLMGRLSFLSFGMGTVPVTFSTLTSLQVSLPPQPAHPQAHRSRVFTSLAHGKDLINSY